MEFELEFTHAELKSSCPSRCSVWRPIRREIQLSAPQAVCDSWVLHLTFQLHLHCSTLFFPPQAEAPRHWIHETVTWKSKHHPPRCQSRHNDSWGVSTVQETGNVTLFFKVVKQAGHVAVYTIPMITAPVKLSLSNWGNSCCTQTCRGSHTNFKS